MVPLYAAPMKDGAVQLGHIAGKITMLKVACSC
jgi:hypothetical protein